jgi:predicted regulator of Ras-like GTPase activity (Roadblock/LC7/MglB family)
MPASPASPSSIQDLLHAEFRRIRVNVSGVHGSVVATSDGFLIAHDVPDLDPADLAALLAASRSLASRGAAISGRGQFREVITRGTRGYLAVYAAGDNAIVGVIGDAELNVAMLHYRVHNTIERITAYASEFSRWASPDPTPTRQPRHRQGSNQYGSTQRGPDQRGPDQRGPDQRGPDQRGPDQRGPDQRGPDQRAPDQRGPDQRAPDQRAPDQRGPDQQSAVPLPVRRRR